MHQWKILGPLSFVLVSSVYAFIPGHNTRLTLNIWPASSIARGSSNVLTTHHRPHLSPSDQLTAKSLYSSTLLKLHATSKGDHLEIDDGEDEKEYKSAVLKTLGAVGLSALFAAGIYFTRDLQSAEDFVTGYIVEQSLSVDNLLVFKLIFDYFKVPVSGQDRVLTYGITGAVFLRGVMIGIGEVAINQFRPAFLIFAAVLIFSSYKILAGLGEDEDEEGDLSNNAVVKFSSSLLKTSSEYDGDRFFTTAKKGSQNDKVSKNSSKNSKNSSAKAAQLESTDGGDGDAAMGWGDMVATPLLLCVLCVELSDIVFAVDSIPAVLGVTTDPFVVYTSNIFAILGLRALYKVLVRVIADYPYIEPAVGGILGFIGVKLGLGYFGYDIDSLVSLGVVLSALGAGVGASYVLPPPEED